MEDNNGQGYEPNPKIQETVLMGGKDITVVRTLTHEKIEEATQTPRWKLVEPHKTKEGFNVRGNNEDGVIKNLTSLEGKPIYELEDIMRPRRASVAGFLGKDEALLTRMTTDNSLVHSLLKKDGKPLEHEDILQATLEIRAAVRQVDTSDKAIIYENNNGRLLVGRNQYLGSQESPFDTMSSNENYSVINMNNGASVTYSGLAPDLIARGFYEGHTSYRMDPREMAETHGLVAIPENDPVVALNKDKEAVAVITSIDQIKRMYSFLYLDKNMYVYPNWKVESTDINVGLQAVFQARNFKEDQMKDAVLERINLETLERGKVKLGMVKGYHFEGTSEYTLRSTLPKLLETHPDVVNTVVQKIESIEFPPDGLSDATEFVLAIVRDYRHRLEALPKPPQKGIITNAINKLRRSPPAETQLPESVTQVRDYYRTILQKLSDKSGIAEALKSTTFLNSDITIQKQLQTFLSDL